MDGISLSEEAYESAIEHGVFNEAPAGSIVRASVSPSGDSWLIILVGLWGIVWSLYWAVTIIRLYNKWDQQMLSFFLGMLLLTVIILGMIYKKYVMPDIVIVKSRRNKYITAKDPESWKKYEV